MLPPLRQLILFLWLCSLGTLALADDHITERAWFEDPGGTLDFAEIRERPFTPFTGILNQGYSAATFWVRLRLDPGQAAQDGFPMDTLNPLILRIRPTYLDDIALFDPLQGIDPLCFTGDHHDWEKDEYRSLNLNFVVPRGNAPRDVWLRIRSTSTVQFHVEALNIDATLKKDNQQYLVNGLYLALIVLFLVWALIHWLTKPERIIGIFVAKQLVALFYAFAYLGYLRIFLDGILPAPSISLLLSLLVVLTAFTSAFFDYAFLREFSPPRWAARSLISLIVGIFVIALLLMLTGHLRQALQVNMIGVLLAPFLALTLAITARGWQDTPPGERPVLPKAVLVATYVLMTVSLFLASAPALGLIKSVEISLHTFLIHGLVSGIVILGILQFRARRLDQRHQRTLAQLAVAEHEIIQERSYRAEQAQFMAMMTHEMKTPLAVVRMVLGTPNPTDRQIAGAQQAINDMNGVIERCVQADKLAAQRLNIEPESFSLASELRELQRNSPAPERLVLQLEAAPTITTDPQLLRIILGNLIDNACKYSPPDSTVNVRCTRKMIEVRPQVEITVENLPGDAGWPDPAQVFAKYYRHKQAQRQTGSGLGLYLVAGLAKMLNGRIDYTPDDTHIRFTLCLPI
jgi:two-component system, sensor histidine kinase LadS